ncbi:hypothetical protein ISCGN_002269 [Ixodes scapularis]
MRPLKFAILNCVSLLARRRKQWVLDTILHERVAVAFLQETKIATDGQVEELTRFFDRHFVIFLSRTFGQSGGTAIMIRKKKIIAICPDWEGDRNGRVWAVEMLHCGQLHRLVSAYAPNDATERRDFFKNLRQYLDTPCRTILAGDFNCVLAERDCLKRLKADVSRLELRKLLRDFDLVDAKDNEKTADPTYTHWQGNYHARLDGIYLSGEFSAMTPVLEVLPLAFSDHALVTIKELLEGKTGGAPMNALTREELKEDVKLKAFRHSQVKAARERAEKRRLMKTLEILIAEENRSPGLFSQDIRDCKGNILELLENEYRGAMVRSRTLFLERDEEPSKIFKKKKRQHASRNKIGKLQVGDVEVTRQEEIEDAFLQAYTDLFTRVEDDGVLQTTGVALPKISPKVRKQMNRKITASEVEEAIKELAPRKSPGVDGLGSQFYKTFSAQLCPILRDMHADVLKRGLLPPSMRQAVTVLIQKKNSKGTPKVGHFRPISLLTSDYKILAKILAKRLEWGLRDVVGEHQAYGIKRRTISTNLHAMRIVCEAAQVLKLPVAVLQDGLVDPAQQRPIHEPMNQTAGTECGQTRTAPLLVGHVPCGELWQQRLSQGAYVRRQQGGEEKDQSTPQGTTMQERHAHSGWQPSMRGGTSAYPERGWVHPGLMRHPTGIGLSMGDASRRIQEDPTLQYHREDIPAELTPVQDGRTPVYPPPLVRHPMHMSPPAMPPLWLSGLVAETVRQQLGIGVHVPMK